jgi:4-diphosphocytidyl-2-C-methyl-D-erythritol kinase
MREVRIPAFAKINLRLDILGKRADGYHELRTIFQTVSLHDELRLLAAKRPGIALSILGNESLSHEPIQKNLVYRAVDALHRELKIRSGVQIELKKSIPAGRGLGGGSSDAAAALLGYLRLTGKKLPTARLMEIAASLGADVPFFLFGGRALGVNKGDEIYPLQDIAKRAVLIVSPPDIHVPTPDAYRWLKAKPLASAAVTSRPALTKSSANSKLFQFCALCWSAQGSGLSNDFEGPVFRRHPRLAAIKRGLLQRGAAEASLAGSGSAVFGVFPSPAMARRAAVGFPHDQTFVCETLSRDRYFDLIKGAPRTVCVSAADPQRLFAEVKR